MQFMNLLKIKSRTAMNQSLNVSFNSNKKISSLQNEIQTFKHVYADASAYYRCILNFDFSPLKAKTELIPFLTVAGDSNILSVRSIHRIIIVRLCTYVGMWWVCMRVFGP